MIHFIKGVRVAVDGIGYDTRDFEPGEAACFAQDVEDGLVRDGFAEVVASSDVPEEALGVGAVGDGPVSVGGDEPEPQVVKAQEPVDAPVAVPTKNRDPRKPKEPKAAKT